MCGDRRSKVIERGLSISFQALIPVVIAVRKVRATDSSGSLCFIIVSESQDYSAAEVSKATAFYEYSLEQYGEENIIYLTNLSYTGSDGAATIANIESAFEWLDENSLPITDIVIYVSDHAKRVFSESFFEFDNGNLSLSTMDNWMDQMSFDDLTFIANGERSGLAGLVIMGSSREIICTMGPNAFNSPDLFNIIRSLEDQSVDTNYDSIVSFEEAYWKEVENLEGSGQDPIMF